MLLKICLNIDANLQALQQFPSAPGDTRERGRIVRNWLGKRISQSTRLVWPRLPSHIEIEPKVKF